MREVKVKIYPDYNVPVNSSCGAFYDAAMQVMEETNRRLAEQLTQEIRVNQFRIELKRLLQENE